MARYQSDLQGVKTMNRFQKSIIDTALDDPSLLSAWEYDFVNDLASKSEEYELSEKQNAILNRISQKYV